MEFPSDKPRLLIIEDDFENQKLLQYYLRKNFIADVCDSSESFSTKISGNKYDIFLIDISLNGDENGLDITRRLREIKEYKNVPIVCISAHVFPKDKELAFESGVDEFLERPIDNQKMLDILIKVYKNKSGQILE